MSIWEMLENRRHSELKRRAAETLQKVQAWADLHCRVLDRVNNSLDKQMADISKEYNEARSTMADALRHHTVLILPRCTQVVDPHHHVDLKWT